MFDFQFIDNILSIDPSYIALFAAMIFGFIQAVKGLGAWAEKYTLFLVFIFSAILATLIVYGVNKIVSIIALTQIISAAASGLYGWGKKTTTIEIPDYSDEN